MELKSPLANSYITNTFAMQLFQTIGRTVLNKGLEVNIYFTVMQI